MHVQAVGDFPSEPIWLDAGTVIIMMAGTSIHSSDPAYPVYLFSCWADSAQDPYKRPLSRAVEKRRDLQKSLGGHSEAGKQEREKR